MPTEPYISMPGLASLGLSGVTYLMARSKGAESRALDSLKCLSDLSDVSQHVSRLPTKVAVRGRAKPKLCKLGDQHYLPDEELEEVKRGWGLTFEHTNAWRGQSPLQTSRISDAVEWYLEDDFGAAVAVEKGMDAQHVRSTMEACSASRTGDAPTVDVRSPFGKMSVGPFAPLVKPIKCFGVPWRRIFRRPLKRRTDKMLPCDKLVTVVGELDLASSCSTAPSDGAPGDRLVGDGSGGAGGHRPSAYALRKPAGGRGPFIISPLTLEELKAKASRSASSAQVLPAVFAVLAVVLLAGKASAAWLADRRNQRQRRQHLTAAAAATHSSQQQEQRLQQEQEQQKRLEQEQQELRLQQEQEQRLEQERLQQEQEQRLQQEQEQRLQEEEQRLEQEHSEQEQLLEQEQQMRLQQEQQQRLLEQQQRVQQLQRLQHEQQQRLQQEQQRLKQQHQRRQQELQQALQQHQARLQQEFRLSQQQRRLSQEQRLQQEVHLQ